jgi:N-acetylneuraminic acid mutarotase
LVTAAFCVGFVFGKDFYLQAPSSLLGDKFKVIRRFWVAGGLGLIVVVALCVFTAPLAYAEEVENSWMVMERMSGPRGALGATVLDGKVYAIGGLCQMLDLSLPVRNNEAYTPATNTWTTLKSMPTARYWFGTATFDNQIYCIGGSQTANITDANEVYDPASNTWTNKTPMPTPRYQLCTYAVNGKIYAIGGVNATGITGVNQAYDIATDSWTTKTPMPTPVANFSSVFFDNKIYIIGGATSSGNVSLTQIYDPAKDRWSRGVDLPVAMSQISAAATTGYYATKGIYVLGSHDSWFFSQEMNDWLPAFPMPTSREGTSVAALDDYLYVLGGFESSSYAASFTANERYTAYGYGTGPPTAFIVSPQNSQNYNTSNVALQFTLNKNASELKYSLDGKQKVAISGNTTLAGLSNAEHTITVYASDGKGNIGTSQTVSFTINSQTPTISNLTLAGVVVALAVVACAGLLFFFAIKKRKAASI